MWDISWLDMIQTKSLERHYIDSVHWPFSNKQGGSLCANISTLPVQMVFAPQSEYCSICFWYSGGARYVPYIHVPSPAGTTSARYSTDWPWKRNLRVPTKHRTIGLKARLFGKVALLWVWVDFFNVSFVSCWWYFFFHWWSQGTDRKCRNWFEIGYAKVQLVIISHRLLCIIFLGFLGNNDLTWRPHHRWWLDSGIIPKWLYFRLVKSSNLPKYSLFLHAHNIVLETQFSHIREMPCAFFLRVPGGPSSWTWTISECQRENSETVTEGLSLTHTPLPTNIKQQILPVFTPLNILFIGKLRVSATFMEILCEHRPLVAVYWPFGMSRRALQKQHSTVHCHALVDWIWIWIWVCMWICALARTKKPKGMDDIVGCVKVSFFGCDMRF